MRVAQSLMTDDLMIHYFFPLPGDAPARERHHLYLHATIFVNTQIAEERRNYHPLPELLRKLSVTHYIIVFRYSSQAPIPPIMQDDESVT